MLGTKDDNTIDKFLHVFLTIFGDHDVPFPCFHPKLYQFIYYKRYPYSHLFVRLL